MGGRAVAPARRSKGLGSSSQVMPVTPFQKKIAKLLSQNRTPDSHLAGGAALHFEPRTLRFSNDLDYFHDSVERVASAFAADKALLADAGYSVDIAMNQPGFIRVDVGKGKSSTKIEWAHDSAWRFMPAQKDPDCGYRLHPVDLSINKVLALVGRDEPRDFLDVLEVHREVLPLGCLCWAAAGKDPGFTPHSLLELLRRRGRYRPEDFERLNLNRKVPPLTELKQRWLSATDSAAQWLEGRKPEELGCLYYSPATKMFVDPDRVGDAVPHFGAPGGVVPVFR